MATPTIPRKKVEESLGTLEKNAQTLIHNLESLRQQTRQIEADLTATRGAIQFARQLLVEDATK
jgi:predicted  nucleic acid-binding Zn-ribbon protein